MTPPACTDADPNIFFPEKGGCADDALRMCLTVCAARDGGVRLRQCASYGLTEDVFHHVGIVGGLTPRDRRAWRQGLATVAEIHRRHRSRLGIGATS